MITADELKALVELLNATPMNLASRLFAQGFIDKLGRMIEQAAQPEPVETKEDV